MQEPLTEAKYSKNLHVLCHFKEGFEDSWGGKSSECIF